MSTSTYTNPDCTILLIGGSLRAGSVNAAVLNTAQTLAPEGAAVTLYGRLGDLPHYNPDDDHDPLPEPVADLRARLAVTDAVLFSTPEYAGTLPGSFKNLLDWTVGGGIYDKPVAWINASGHGGAQGTHQVLRVVLAFTGSDLVETACVQVPVPRSAVGTDGIIGDPEIRAAISQALTSLLERVSDRRRFDVTAQAL